MPSNTGNSQLASADDVDIPARNGVSTNPTSPSEVRVSKSKGSSPKHTKNKNTEPRQPQKENKTPVLEQSSSSEPNTTTDSSSSASDSDTDSSDSSMEDFKKWRKQKQRRKSKTVTKQIRRLGKRSHQKVRMSPLLMRLISDEISRLSFHLTPMNATLIRLKIAHPVMRRPDNLKKSPQCRKCRTLYNFSIFSNYSYGNPIFRSTL